MGKSRSQTSAGETPRKLGMQLSRARQPCQAGKLRCRILSLPSIGGAPLRPESRPAEPWAGPEWKCRQAGHRYLTTVRAWATIELVGRLPAILPTFLKVGLWRSWERASMAWKRSSVRSRPGPPNFSTCHRHKPPKSTANHPGTKAITSPREPSSRKSRAHFGCNSGVQA
jgi:hypothetical protein